MGSPDEVGPIFDKVVERFKRVSRKRRPLQVIEQANAMLLNVIKNTESKKGDLVTVIKQLQDSGYLVQL
jgi:hypothetical protein